MIQKIKHRLMASSREKKYSDFIQLSSLTPDSTILDVGVANKEHSPHDNFLEKNYPFPSRITALSVQGISEFERRYPEIRAVVYGGGRFPFADNAFSVVHANAVIEHVGGFADQVDFIREMARCGRRFFFSTPAREFPFEIHTNYPVIHWLPKPAFDYLAIRLGKAWATGNYMQLLTRKGVGNLLRAAGIGNYRLITYRIWGIPYQHIVFADSGNTADIAASGPENCGDDVQPKKYSDDLA